MRKGPMLPDGLRGPRGDGLPSATPKLPLLQQTGGDAAARHVTRVSFHSEIWMADNTVSVTTDELSRLFGINRQQVSHLVDRGVL